MTRRPSDEMGARAGREADVHRIKAEREIDDELAFHRERTIAELIDRGMSQAEAEAEAVRRFGSPVIVSGSLGSRCAGSRVKGGERCWKYSERACARSGEA
jgi:hypothetical protein